MNAPSGGGNVATDRSVPLCDQSPVASQSITPPMSACALRSTLRGFGSGSLSPGMRLTVSRTSATRSAGGSGEDEQPAKQTGRKRKQFRKCMRAFMAFAFACDTGGLSPRYRRSEMAFSFRHDWTVRATLHPPDVGENLAGPHVPSLQAFFDGGVQILPAPAR